MSGDETRSERALLVCRRCEYAAPSPFAHRCPDGERADSRVPIDPALRAPRWGDAGGSR